MWSDVRSNGRVGRSVTVPLDSVGGPEFNVSLESVRREVLSWIRMGLIWFVWIASPCLKLSQAHGVVSLDGASLHCARFTVDLVKTFIECGVWYCIENPWSSRLWEWPAFYRVLQTSRATHHRTDQCADGAGWKKPTWLVSNVDEPLGLLCPGHRKHVRLRGAVVVDGNAKWRMRGREPTRL